MDPVLEALVTVRKARHKVEAVRDVLPQVSSQLEYNSMMRLFEAPFMDSVVRMSKVARHSVFSEARNSGGPLMSTFNEYVQYMELVELILSTPLSQWERPANQYSSEVQDSNNPLRAAFAVFRTNPHLSENVVASVLEAAFPLAVAGLDEPTRNALFKLASDRGVTAVEIANAYAPLIDLVADVRFVEDEETRC